MELTLKQDVTRFIEDQVRAGRFGSASEVIEAAVGRLMLDDSTDELDEHDLAAIAKSEEQIARGEARDFKEVAAELRAKYLNK